MPYDPPPELAGLSLPQIAELIASRKLPPLPRWNPQVAGDSAMRIARDGQWFHEGAPVRKPAMVRAFSQLLMRDVDGRHWLVTPMQKLAIEVEDAAFVAVDVTRQDDALVFRLNTDEFVIAGPQNPVAMRGSEALPAAYLGVRHGLEARINRKTWLQLAEIAIDRGDFKVASQGCLFSLEAPR